MTAAWVPAARALGHSRTDQMASRLQPWLCMTRGWGNQISILQRQENARVRHVTRMVLGQRWKAVSSLQWSGSSTADALTIGNATNSKRPNAHCDYENKENHVISPLYYWYNICWTGSLILRRSLLTRVANFFSQKNANLIKNKCQRVQKNANFLTHSFKSRIIGGKVYR